MARTSGDNTMFNDPDAWMRTKPMPEKMLWYVCHITDTTKSLPWTPQREKSISTMFHNDEYNAVLALKQLAESRKQHYVCKITECEQRLAELAKKKNECP